MKKTDIREDEEEGEKAECSRTYTGTSGETREEKIKKRTNWWARSRGEVTLFEPINLNTTSCQFSFILFDLPSFLSFINSNLLVHCFKRTYLLNSSVGSADLNHFLLDLLPNSWYTLKQKNKMKFIHVISNIEEEG